MAQRRVAARTQELHVVPIEQEQLPSERHLRAVGSDPSREFTRGADIISIDSARARRPARPAEVKQKEPAILAKWAVGLSVVMFLAALTSGQA
jgi:hypothetical protein